MIALELEAASADLDGRPVLRAATLAVAQGELVALVGPNGAGKSSVLRALAGLLAVSDGEARLGGRDVRAMSARERAAWAGYLPQERRIAWNLPAVEVAALGAPFLDHEAAMASARAALVEVEAGHLADRGVADMSGGERARVLLARVLAARTRALLVDEPLAGLDPEAQLMVLDRLGERARRGQAVLVSLHDLDLAARRADRLIVMHEGRPVADAAPRDALSPAVLAKVFRLSGRWLEGPDGAVLATGRHSDGAGAGVVRPASPT